MKSESLTAHSVISLFATVTKSKLAKITALGSSTAEPGRMRRNRPLTRSRTIVSGAIWHLPVPFAGLLSRWTAIFRVRLCLLFSGWHKMREFDHAHFEPARQKY